MKVKIISVIIALCAMAGVCSSCGASIDDREGVQALNYEETTAAIANPNQGFYRPLYVKIDEHGLEYNKTIINETAQLYHLRCDISKFSSAVNGKSDLPLTSEATDGLDKLLSYLKEKDKNAVIRFAYDSNYSGNANKEPKLDVILQHVEQVCSVITRYENTVTAIETGLIGPWGEMHTSVIANAAHITPIADAFLSYTTNIPVAVRTTKMIYDYLGIDSDKANEYEIAPNDKAYRLGLYNDGYLGSDSDLGTYSDRRRDVSFLSRQNNHLPFGGEVTVPDSSLHNINVCLPEMKELHLSYLNSEWDNRVIDKWKKSFYTKECGSDKAYYGETAFRYIENRLGYRFVLKSSVFTYNDAGELNIDIKLKNVGFGNLNRKKRAKLLFTDVNGIVAFEKEVAEFEGNENITYKLKPEQVSGKYDVYLRLYGEEYQGTPLYCVQFANSGLWESKLKANKIGVIELV